MHDWCIGAVGFGMGRCGLLALEVIEPDDYIEEIATRSSSSCSGSCGASGRTATSSTPRTATAAGSTSRTSSTQIIGAGRARSSRAARNTSAFTQFNAAAELLAFLDHYDCRLGLGDTGPYELPDGKLLILRDLFVNEEVFHWSDVCDDATLPHCYTARAW